MSKRKNVFSSRDDCLSYSPGIFWGKFDPIEGVHPLSHHCADVAACFEELLSVPTVARKLASAGGCEVLENGVKSRLAALVFLHDIGKIALGFQLQICQPQLRYTPPRKGHLYPIVSLLYSQNLTDQWISEALGIEEINTWDHSQGDTVASLLLASLAHHGKPLDTQLCNQASNQQDQWRPQHGLDPKAEAHFFGKRLRDWFEPAFKKKATPLPDTTEFHHCFAGLVALADWLGSDKRFFPFDRGQGDSYIEVARKNAGEAVAAVGLNVQYQRKYFSSPRTPADLFNFPELRPLQQGILDAPVDANALILEAETGAGKTEAALLRFAQLYAMKEVDSLYFALPTRSAAVQLHRRVCDFADRLFGKHSPQVVLALPGYLKAGETKGSQLPNFVVEWDDNPDARRQATRWAAEHSKRFLAAQIAVGTVDQVMLSAMPVKHAHMRASCLTRSLLVIDELHASDAYMSVIIERVVKQQLKADAHVLMMSATLTDAARTQWLCGNQANTKDLEPAIAVDYPLLSWSCGNHIKSDPIKNIGISRDIAVSVTATNDDTLSEHAWQAAHAGAKVLIIRNTVREAVALLQQLQRDAAENSEMLFNVNGVNTLHHSRFASEDRHRLDTTVEQWLSGNRIDEGAIIVGTQTLEQSLDIDADLLITDLCPIDVLLQRIGRLHRHRRKNRASGFEQPRALIASPHVTDLQPLLTRGQSGLGPRGRVYADLVAVQNTLSLIHQYPVWQIPKMNRELVERALHPDARTEFLDRSDVAWRNAQQAQDGEETADIQAAQQNPVHRELAFYDPDIRFPERGINLPTRLGANNFLLQLNEPARGPFGFPVANFSIPTWMLVEDIERYQEPPEIELIDGGGFDIVFDVQRFRYSNFGIATQG